MLGYPKHTLSEIHHSMYLHGFRGPRFQFETQHLRSQGRTISRMSSFEESSFSFAASRQLITEEAEGIMRRQIPRNVTRLPPTQSWDPGFSILNFLRKEVDREKYEQERVNLVMSHLSGAVTDFPHGVSRKVSRTLRKASEILHEDPEETTEESDLLPRKFETSDSELIPTKKKLKLYKKRNRTHQTVHPPKPPPAPLKRKTTIPISPRLNTRIRFERRQALSLHQKEGEDTSAAPESSDSPLLLPRAASAFAVEESHTPEETQILEEPRRVITLPPLSLPPRTTEISPKKVRFSQGVEIIPRLRTPSDTSRVRIVNDAFMRPVTLLEGRLGPFPRVSDDRWATMELDADLRSGVDRIMSLPTSRFRKQAKGVDL